MLTIRGSSLSLKLQAAAIASVLLSVGGVIVTSNLYKYTNVITCQTSRRLGLSLTQIGCLEADLFVGPAITGLVFVGPAITGLVRVNDC